MSGPFAKQVADVVPAIETAVGLKFKQPPKVESRSKAQVREFVSAQITDPKAAKEFAGITAAYKRLGMIPDSLNLQKFLIDLLEEQIVGYYDPKTKSAVRRERRAEGSRGNHDNARARSRFAGSVYQS